MHDELQHVTHRPTLAFTPIPYQQVQQTCRPHREGDSLVQLAWRSRWQVQKPSGPPEQEPDLHTAILASQGTCTRELISLQPRCTNLGEN